MIDIGSLKTIVITVSYAAVLLTALFVLIKYPNVICRGKTPVGTFTFVALLFTAGLDMGLVMLPLNEFRDEYTKPEYGFTNSLAIEFGMWGPLVWMMYFLSAFYFVALEPRLKLFEISIVKWIYNLTVIATCAFTGYLFLVNLPFYAPGLSASWIWLIVVGAIGVSVYSSSNVNFMKWLAILSTWGFGVLVFAALIIVSFAVSGSGFLGLFQSIGNLQGYFSNIYRFVSPITDYHAFYLYWWFSWSIMIGQFVATFVGGMKSWKLAVVMVVFPTIPIGLWFSVLYIYFEKGIDMPDWLDYSMIAVGIVFVVNSLDSLIRLYSSNLGWTTAKLGNGFYYLLHFTLQFSLVLAYQYLPWFKIELVGAIVIALYAMVYWRIFMNAFKLRFSTSNV